MQTSYMEAPVLNPFQNAQQDKLSHLEDFCCKEFKLTHLDFRSKSHHPTFVFARQIFFHIARSVLHIKITRIADYLDKHHATVIHSDRRIKDFLHINSEEGILAEQLINKYNNT
jgi:chromosomal replication initiation ATPase DnaA